MPLAIDTVGIFRTSGGGADTVFAASTVAPGDSLQIRNSVGRDSAHLERIMHDARAGSAFRVRSPVLHDVAEGIQLFVGQNPGAEDDSDYARQVLQPQDVLIAEQLVNAITSTDVFALGIVYDDLPGSSPRLHTWAEIAPLVKNVKFLQVKMAGTFAVGSWLDTALTATENLLHANTDYAVLGFITDTAVCAAGLKGMDTGNLRICGPGVVDVKVTKDYFIVESERHGGPRIPVINAANAPSSFVSVYSKSTPVNVNIQLQIAELARNV